MQIVCLDLEGVLVPEIWIEFAERTGIPELRRTTREEPNYDVLMQYRLGILKQHGLGLPDIQKVIAEMGPLPGAKEFVEWLRPRFQVVIRSPCRHPLLPAGKRHPRVPPVPGGEGLRSPQGRDPQGQRTHLRPSCIASATTP